jgi:hypothetical protein
MFLTKRADNLIQQLVIQNRDLQELLVRQQREHMEAVQKLTEALIATTNRPALQALHGQQRELKRPDLKPKFPGSRPLPEPPRPGQILTGVIDNE